MLKLKIHQNNFRTCFRWTKCTRCVLFDYGPTCLSEITQYSFEVSDTGEITCLDEYVPAPEGEISWHQGYGPGEVPGCRRAVCECDKAEVLALKNRSYFSEHN